MLPIGDTIKRLRVEKGMTQEELANLLNVKRTTIASWERDARVPQVETARKMAELFKVPLSVIIPDRNSPTQYVSTGRRLEQLLEASSISYDEDLARQLGTDMYGLETWLEGSRTPTFEELTRAARVFGVTLATVRGETKEIVREAQDDDVWAEREALRRDPDRRALLDLARHGSAKSVRQVAALIDALKATNPDFYDGDDPA